MIVSKGENVFAILQSMNLPFPCNGRGKCGKCKFKVTKNELPYTEKETQILTENEKKEGIHLACCHTTCEQDIECEITREQNFQIEGIQAKCSTADCGFVAGVDIGTTTIVVAIYEGKTGNCVYESKKLNPQRSFGSDVISRIDACSQVGVSVLQQQVVRIIEDALLQSKLKIDRICVCGNATMTHIFMGLDVYSIGQAPYTCQQNEYIEMDSQTIFQYLPSCPLQVLPPISSFVGSDILAGLMILQDFENQNSLFLDLGTNGEMVLYNQQNKTRTATSSACGPCFEGGQMSCGMGAISGAIQSIWYDKEWKYTTIDKKEAIGICGSGYISFLSQCLKHNFIDETGYMENDIYITDDIYLSQKDVREFQLAKAAMSAAILTLLEKENMKVQELDCLYLAGGFSSHLDIENAIQIGLFPSDWKDKIVIVGNSAIHGVCEFALSQNIQKCINYQQTKTIDLNQDVTFTNYFMEQMYFKKV
ncbi:ASKHA domain-containing protein [Floccifex sp.]|uniref:ASKHA domain-containing protein n=1 Tax=Floccifex sp. TaxID=2815810 RepID=UPI003F087BFC